MVWKIEWLGLNLLWIFCQRNQSFAKVLVDEVLKQDHLTTLLAQPSYTLVNLSLSLASQTPLSAIEGAYLDNHFLWLNALE